MGACGRPQPTSAEQGTEATLQIPSAQAHVSTDERPADHCCAAPDSKSRETSLIMVTTEGLQSGFSQHRAIDFRDQVTFWQARVFGGTTLCPGLRPLDVSSTPPSPADNQKCPQTLGPNIPWGTKSPPSEDLWFRACSAHAFYPSHLLPAFLAHGGGHSAVCPSAVQMQEQGAQWLVRGHRAGILAKLRLEPVISPWSLCV